MNGSPVKVSCGSPTGFALILFRPELKTAPEIMEAYLDEYKTAGKILEHAPVAEGGTIYGARTFKKTEASTIEELTREPEIALAVACNTDSFNFIL